MELKWDWGKLGKENLEMGHLEGEFAEVGNERFLKKDEDFEKDKEEVEKKNYDIKKIEETFEKRRGRHKDFRGIVEENQEKQRT